MIGLLISLAVVAVNADAESLKIAVEGAYPPFNSVNERGEPVGLDVDLGKELCKRLNATCDWVVHDFAGMIPGLEAKRFDLVVSSMSITDKRKEKVLFSDPYYKAPAVYIRHKKTQLTPPLFPETKEKIRTGVQRSSTYADYLRANPSDRMEVVSYDDLLLSIQDLKAGRIQLVLGQYVVIGRLLKDPSNAELITLGAPFRDEKLMGAGAGIAARKSDTDLINRVNLALKGMRADGAFAKIRSKYFSNACEMDIRECH